MSYKGNVKNNTETQPKFKFMSKKDKSIKINLNHMILEFLYVKRVERRSPRTISAYEGSLEQFAKWYELSGADGITRDLIRSYIEYLTYEKKRWDDHPTSPTKGAGLSPRTVNNNIRNLRIFFNHLLSERRISYSPMDGVNYQREAKDTFDIFTDDDVKLLLSAPNQKVYSGFRDYCMMLVLCDTGLRVKELTGIRVRDVEFADKQLYIDAGNVKTSATRIVPISEESAAALLKLRTSMNIEDDDYLFLTQFGERYFGDTFAKMLKLYAKRVGVTGPRVSPHTFRHYFAVKFLHQGGDPIALMRILGHSSFATTEKYVKYAAVHIKEQHERVKPLAGLLRDSNSKKGKTVRFK